MRYKWNPEAELPHIQICQDNKACRAIYDTDKKTLVLSEPGSFFLGGLAAFSNISQHDAEFVLSKVTRVGITK